MDSNDYVDERYPLSELTGRAIAAARVVHQELGSGFEEIIYQRALGIELPAHGVEFDREVWIEVLYKGKSIGKKRVDFVVGDRSGSALVEMGSYTRDWSHSWRYPHPAQRRGSSWLRGTWRWRACRIVSNRDSSSRRRGAL